MKRDFFFSSDCGFCILFQDYVFLNFSSQALVFVAFLVDCICFMYFIDYNMMFGMFSDTFHEVKGKRERKKEVRLSHCYYHYMLLSSVGCG